MNRMSLMETLRACFVDAFRLRAFLMVLVLPVALLLAAVELVAATPPVYAANIVVNTTVYGEHNDGKCSVTEAILAANTNTDGATDDCTPGDDSPVDTIVLSPLTFPVTGTYSSNL